MREHPIPQDVVGYRFHIIGNMTLKQFVEVGAGCLVAVLIYSTNLYPIIKWPLIMISIGLGAMIAFVPFEERPLDHWVITFFRVLYRPTKFYWRREPKIPDPFLYESTDTSNSFSEIDLSPQRRQRIKDYLRSVETDNNQDPLDTAELVRINSIMAAFDMVQVGSVEENKQLIKPQLKVRARALKGEGEDIKVPVFTVDSVEEAPRTPYVRQDIAFTKPALPTDQVARDINIPELTQMEIVVEAMDEIGATTATTPDTIGDRAFVADAVPVPAATAAQDITHNTALPFPEPPSDPNKIVGMVLTPNDELINDAIVEIQGSDGRVARAVKTNALGQFFVTTPLEDGEYVLLVEKDGHQFVTQGLQLNGNVVPPVEIRSVA